MLILPVGLGIVLVGLVVWSVQNEKLVMEQDHTLRALTRKVFQLSMLSHNIILHTHEERVRKQVLRNLDDLTGILHQISQEEMGAAENLSRLRQDNEEFGVLLRKLLTMPKKISHVSAEKLQVLKESENRLVGRIAITANEIVSETLVLSGRINDHQRRMNHVHRAEPGSNLLCLKYTDISEIIACHSGMQGKPGTNLEY
jgi:hypothetical protein